MKQNTEEKENTMITEESILQEYEEFLKSGKEITVEHATLEEINQVMVEHGLEPFTEEDSRKARLYRGMCEDIAWYGDWTGNGVLSTLDIVYASSYIYNWSGYPYQDLIRGYVEPVNCCGHQSEVYEFALVSSIYNNSEALRLDKDDIDIVRWWILGIICYP